MIFIRKREISQVPKLLKNKCKGINFFFTVGLKYYKSFWQILRVKFVQNKGDFIGLYLPENLWHCKPFLYFNFSMDKVSVVNVEPKELSKITYLLINLQLVLQEER